MSKERMRMLLKSPGCKVGEWSWWYPAKCSFHVLHEGDSEGSHREYPTAPPMAESTVAGIHPTKPFILLTFCITTLFQQPL